MGSIAYFERHSKFLTTGMSFLNPNSSKSGKFKISFRFLIVAFSHASFLYTIIEFLLKNYRDLEYAHLAEVVATILTYTRSLFYIILIFIWNSKWKSLTDRIVEERESLKDENLWQLTLNYSKKESSALIIWLISASSFTAFSLSSCFFFETNGYQLPINYHIVWLPVEEKFSWIVNFSYQAIVSILGSSFFYVYFPLTLTLMYHTCWGVQALILMVEGLGQTIDQGEHKTTKEQKDLILKQIRRIIEMSCSVQEWQKKVQFLLRFSFLFEFTFLSILTCLCVYTITLNIAGSTYIVFIMFYILFQLYVYCWLGSRLKTLIEQLLFALYNIKWYTFEARHQKFIQILLLNTQNMKGFNGVFKVVELTSFQKVLEFSYSLLALLRGSKF